MTLSEATKVAKSYLSGSTGIHVVTVDDDGMCNDYPAPTWVRAKMIRSKLEQNGYRAIAIDLND